MPWPASSTRAAHRARPLLIETLIGQGRAEGIDIPYSATTEYVNTIPVSRQPKYPGDPTIEIKIRNYLRWNAMALVVRANKHTNVGGHIASYASSAAMGRRLQLVPGVPRPSTTAVT